MCNQAAGDQARASNQAAASNQATAEWGEMDQEWVRPFRQSKRTDGALA